MTGPVIIHSKAHCNEKIISLQYDLQPILYYYSSRLHQRACAELLLQSVLNPFKKQLYFRSKINQKFVCDGLKLFERDCSHFHFCIVNLWLTSVLEEMAPDTADHLV